MKENIRNIKSSYEKDELCEKKIMSKNNGNV